MEPLLKRFLSWGQVIAFMRVGTSTDPRKNTLLRVIFGAYGEDRDPRWRTILLVIFWPALESIHRQKRHWDKFEPDLLWQNLQWAFIQTVDRIDTQKRPDRLVQKVYNDTVHRLHVEYRREWSRTGLEDVFEDNEFEGLAGGSESLEIAAFELLNEKDAETKKLKRYLKTGVINEAEFYLAVGTWIYGDSLSEYARRKGLNYGAVKKRNQRLKQKIQQRAKNS